VKIVNPVFIIGIQRSGTTILYDLFAKHRDVAYCEMFSSIMCNKPYLFKMIPALLKLQRIQKGRDFRPIPNEGRIWRRFFSEIEYLDQHQVTGEIKDYYYSAIRYQLKAFGVGRFVSKNPANCLRIKWIDKMFPDARYVIIWRDPASVVSSIFRKMNRRWEYESDHIYEHGYKGYVTVKERFGKDVSKIQACVNYYNHLRSKLLDDFHVIEDRSVTISYEDLVQNPRVILRMLYEHTGLEWYDGLKEAIPDRLKTDMNQQWMCMSEVEQEVLRNNFGQHAPSHDQSHS